MSLSRGVGTGCFVKRLKVIRNSFQGRLYKKISRPKAKPGKEVSKKSAARRTPYFTGIYAAK
jgi:hypothetical protein